MLLQIKDLHKTYSNGTEALKGLSTSVREGEFLTILGKSGSGKSTFLRCINALIQPTSGSVIFDDIDLSQATSKQLRTCRRKIGMIFQHFNLIERASVLTNVLSGRLGYLPSFWGFINHFSGPLYHQAYRNLQRSGLLEKASARADALSGGQRQRVGIARSLMQEPRMILADEPVSSLDPGSAEMILDTLKTINREDGVTVVCNLHQPDLARKYGTRVLALKSGELVFEGSPENLTDEILDHLY